MSFQQVVPFERVEVRLAYLLSEVARTTQKILKGLDTRLLAITSYNLYHCSGPGDQISEVMRSDYLILANTFE